MESKITRSLAAIALIAVAAIQSPAAAQEGGAQPAQPAAPAVDGAPVKSKKLSVGDVAPQITVAKWLKGNEVKTLEQGKVYVVEFWATWCRPCIRNIPHLTELASMYKGQVEILGISVWEQANVKTGRTYDQVVTDFVTSQGDKMGYSVAYDTAEGTAGAMATNWLAAAGRDSIPSAFLVNAEGKIAWIGHPTDLERELKKLPNIVPQKTMAQHEEEAGAPLQQFMQMIEQDEEGAYAMAKKVAEGRMKSNPVLLNGIAWTIVDTEGLKNVNLDLAHELATKAVELTKSKDGMILDTLALVEFKKGNVDRAMELQTKAIEMAENDERADDQMMDEMKERLEQFKAAKK